MAYGALKIFAVLSLLAGIYLGVTLVNAGSVELGAMYLVSGLLGWAVLWALASIGEDVRAIREKISPRPDDREPETPEEVIATRVPTQRF